MKKTLFMTSLIGSMLLSTTIFSQTITTFAIQNETNYSISLQNPALSASSYQFVAPTNVVPPQTTVSNFQIISTNPSDSNSFGLNFSINHTAFGKSFTTPIDQELQISTSSSVSSAYITETTQPQQYIPVKLTLNGSNQIASIHSNFVLSITTNSTYNNSSLF